MQLATVLVLALLSAMQQILKILGFHHFSQGKPGPFKPDVDVGIGASKITGGGHHLAVAPHCLQDLDQRDV